MAKGGYRDCACRDCFDIAIGGRRALCHGCEDAGCSKSGNKECSRDDAYGGEENFLDGVRCAGGGVSLVAAGAAVAIASGLAYLIGKRH